MLHTSTPLMPSRFFDSVGDFVRQRGGDHAIRKILIANNGLGAIKAIRSIRKWCFQTFGNERMVSGWFSFSCCTRTSCNPLFQGGVCSDGNS